MPDIETDCLDDYAVLWSFVRRGGDGEPVVASPVEIPARWSWRRTVTTDETGANIALDASILVDREIAPESIVWQGKLKEYNALAAGTEDRKLMQVKTNSTVQDIKNINVRRRAGLQRFRNTLPTVLS